MGTNIVYNGVRLHNVLTRSFIQEVAYDSSGTDKLYDKYTIEVEGICHIQGPGSSQNNLINQSPQYMAMDAPGGVIAGQGLVPFYNNIRFALSQPRKDFLMEIEPDPQQKTAGDANYNKTQKLLEVKGSDNPETTINGKTDADNGPKPKYVDITHIVANKVFRVRFGIEVCLLSCDAQKMESQPAPPGVINNRWSIDEAMDSNFYITRTIRGRLRILSAKIAGHAIRGIVVPFLEPGFKRESIDFLTSENELDCTYTIVDRQVHTAPPWPATVIEMTHTVSTEDGVTMSSEVAVHLEGPPNVLKEDLMTVAIQLIYKRLGLGKKWDGKYMVQNATFVNHIGERGAVDGRMKILHTFDLDEKSQFVTVADAMTDLIDKAAVTKLTVPNYLKHKYLQNFSPVPAVYGYDPGIPDDVRSNAWLLALGCYLQYPCENRHGYAISGRGPLMFEDEPERDDGGPSSPTTTGYRSPGELPKDENKDHYSAETKSHLYTLAQIESTYYYDSLRVQLPRAAVSLPDKPSDSQLKENTCVTVSLGRRNCRREIVIHYERAGEWPQVPPPKETLDNGKGLAGTLLRNYERVYPPTSASNPSETIYRIDAYYLYAFNRPPLKDEPLNTGVLAYTNFTNKAIALTQTKMYLPESKLKEQGLI